MCADDATAMPRRTCDETKRECGDGHVCLNGECHVRKLSHGQPCSADAQCHSHHCHKRTKPTSLNLRLDRLRGECAAPHHDRVVDFSVD